MLLSSALALLSGSAVAFLPFPPTLSAPIRHRALPSYAADAVDTPEGTTAAERYAALFAADEAAELAAQRPAGDAAWLQQDPHQEEMLRGKDSAYTDLTMWYREHFRESGVEDDLAHW